jgi:hypothetical protein
MGQIRTNVVWNGYAACTSVQTTKIDQSPERKRADKNVHCCDNHANESCTISMTKKIISMYGLSKAIHTNVSSMGPDADIAEGFRLFKDWGKRRKSYSCSFKYPMICIMIKTST